MMNERIRELASKCYKTGPLGRGGWPEYTTFDHETFAELIVKECAKQVNWILAEGGKTQGDLIKQHFGVE